MPGGTSAVSASAGLDNLDQSVAVGNVLTLSSRTVLETRAQFARGDLEAPPTDPTGPSVSISGVAAFGRLSGSPTGRLNSMYQVVNNLVHQYGPSRDSLGCGLPVQRRHHHFSKGRARQPTRSSLWPTSSTGVYNNAGFTQTFGDHVVSQTNGNVGIFLQDEWRAGSRDDVQRRTCATTCSISTRSTRTRTTCRLESASPGRRPTPAARSCARVPAASTTACRCAPWRTRCFQRQHDGSLATAADQREPVAGSGRRAGLPGRFWAASFRLDDARQLHARWTGTSSERVLEPGWHRGRAATTSHQRCQCRVSASSQRRPDHADQSERAGVRGVRQQQRLPAKPRLRQQQPVLMRPAARCTTDCSSHSCKGP